MQNQRVETCFQERNADFSPISRINKAAGHSGTRIPVYRNRLIRFGVQVNSDQALQQSLNGIVELRDMARLVGPIQSIMQFCPKVRVSSKTPPIRLWVEDQCNPGTHNKHATS